MAFRRSAVRSRSSPPINSRVCRNANPFLSACFSLVEEVFMEYYTLTIGLLYGNDDSCTILNILRRIPKLNMKGRVTNSYRSKRF